MVIVHGVLKTISPAGDVSLGTIFQVLEFLRVAVESRNSLRHQFLISAQSTAFAKIFALEIGKGFSMHSNKLRQPINSRLIHTTRICYKKRILAGGHISDSQKDKIHIAKSVYLIWSQVHNYLHDPESFFFLNVKIKVMVSSHYSYFSNNFFCFKSISSLYGFLKKIKMKHV